MVAVGRLHKATPAIISSSSTRANTTQIFSASNCRPHIGTAPRRLVPRTLPSQPGAPAPLSLSQGPIQSPARLNAPHSNVMTDASDAASSLLPRRPLGNTGLEVSVLGFGASPLGGAFGDVDESVAISSVHRAFARGVNLFDTSPYYGLTKSETVLGRALRDLPRSQLVLSTKVGRYGADPRDFDFSAARVTRSVAESLERLQVPYIDIIQCHDIEFGDLDQIVNETLPALAQLRNQGLVRHVGITGLPLEAFHYVLDRAEPGSVDVVLSYCHYCLNDTTLLGSVPYLRSRGVGLINASPLSMGLLTRGGPPDWHPAPPGLREAAARAAAHAAARGRDIAALGLGFALRQPDVSSTLVGMASPEVVDANVDTAMRALGTGAGGDGSDGSDDDEVLGEVLRMLEPVKDTTWPSGRPLPRG
ncbi:hypothetical protein PLESTB_001733100 [Pleodorina starrii]|uniref:NADP-dependent oxidoreductase domain-containing protein n=1 Tax=Pleodorina starrii TaxID=330485 RepID=A0A9W6BZ41_9CHLO|nr:hypothetical protein PLESTM_000735600 [Pleodorina starrii]GLC61226.1 hypothetical protein PLESTB_001733100 [Pleodorina starrii]GLC76889.1 hypothetical protein PLESTF_001852000 [Pleodorina starrii]